MFIFVCVYAWKRIGEPVTHLLGWNVPPDELSTIPEHWLSYPEPPISLHYLLGTLYIAFTCVALIGNGLVLWVFTSYVVLWFHLSKDGKQKGNIHKMNSSMFDICFCFRFCSPFSAADACSVFVLMTVQNHCVHHRMFLWSIWHYVIFWWCQRHQFSFTIHSIMAMLLVRSDVKYSVSWAHCLVLEQPLRMHASHTTGNKTIKPKFELSYRNKEREKENSC